MLTTTFHSLYPLTTVKYQLIFVNGLKSTFHHFMDWVVLTGQCLCADLDTAGSGSALLLGCG